MDESYLLSAVATGEVLLSTTPVPGAATDVVKQDTFDKATFASVSDEAPALREVTYDLGGKHDYTNDLVGDVYNQFWQGDPILRDASAMHPTRLVNHAVVADVEQAPATPQTRMFTRHDRYGAAMATIAVKEHVEELLVQAEQARAKAEEAEQARQELAEAMRALADALGAMPGGESGPAVGGEGPLTKAQAASLEQLLAAIAAAGAGELTFESTFADAKAEADVIGRVVRQQVAKAITEAGDMLAEESELFASWGVEDGVIQQLSFAERQKLASALRRNRLNDFRKLIGRFRVMGAAQRAKKVEYARDEAYDVELSDRLPDLLATEWARIANVHTRLTFLSDLAEGNLLVRKYRGVEKIGQGSIIALIDNSGSMSVGAAARDRGGLTREAWAKAFALTLLDQARASNRDFVGINFSSANQQSVWRFPKGKADIYQVMAFIEEFFNGGTNFERPLDLAVDILEAEFNDAGTMRADLVMITDDDARVSDQWLARYQARKDKLGFRTFGVAVGMNAGNALGSLSDNVRSIFEFGDPMQVSDIIRTV